MVNKLKIRLPISKKTFKDAYDFANTEKGTGLQEGDFGLFDDSVRKLCPNYFDLLPILAERSSSKPKALADEVIKSDYES
jgi:hypothetical protein